MPNDETQSTGVGETLNRGCGTAALIFVVLLIIGAASWAWDAAFGPDPVTQSNARSVLWDSIGDCLDSAGVDLGGSTAEVMHPDADEGESVIRVTLEDGSVWGVGGTFGRDAQGLNDQAAIVLERAGC